MFVPSYHIEQQNRERNNKAIGWTVTILIHALLLIGLLYLTIKTPDPPFEDNEGGMAANFGTSEVGSGNIQPTSLVPVTTQPLSEVTSSSTPISAQENLETQEIEDAPVMNSTKNDIKKPITNPDAQFKPTVKPATNTTPAPPQPDANALFTKGGAKGPNNNSNGDGEGGGKGDQGKLNGDPNATSYKGNGSGNGNGNGGGSGLGNGNVKLTGRSTRYKPTPNNPCSEARGRVNITIKVNQDGKVVGTTFTQSGSTTTDDCLIDVAKRAAAQYLFDVKNDAPAIQTGSIIFIFGER